jgi:small subunit ribosomal protein S15
MAVPAQRKVELVTQFATKKGDTGREVRSLSSPVYPQPDRHLKTHRKDYTSRRDDRDVRACRCYLRKVSPDRYQTLIDRLGLRR